MKLAKIMIACTAAGLLLASCGEEAEVTDTTAARPAPAPETGPAWLLTAAPEQEASPVAAVKETATEGDVVAVRGKIGGRTDPMSTESAFFIMMDPSVPSCADIPGDNCAKPWDYCCETPESKARNSATVQLVDENGDALEIDLTGHGFQPLDEVIVIGTVGPRPSQDVLIIKAAKLHRVQG